MHSCILAVNCVTAVCQMPCMPARGGLEDKYIFTQNIAFLYLEVAKPIAEDMNGSMAWLDWNCLNAKEKVHCKIYIMR